MNLKIHRQKMRHSGEGRNPDKKISPTQMGRHHGLVCFAERFFWLDSGLRRNDGLMDIWHE